MALNQVRAGETLVHLIEIFLPLNSNDGTPQSSDEFRRVREQLVDRWGGVTAFTRAPAKGVCLQNGNQRAEDEIVVFEVMVKRVDKLWWLSYKRDLETQFSQQEILIRVTAVGVIH
jgi:CRISPR/Cas system-associated protein Cas10 (large subunit of type III CRISPR-Cas system)